MKLLHVNDVASVGSILVRASGGRDDLYQPALRRDTAAGLVGALQFASRRLIDVGRLRRRFRTGGYTHCHVHYGLFAHLAELGGLPYSLHIHGGDILLDLASGAKRFLVLRGLRRATHVVVSTPDLLGPARRLRSDVIYIPNPMEIVESPRRRERHEHPRIVMLSKMDRLKGWDRQVTLMEALVKVLPGIELTYFSHGQLPEVERRGLSERLHRLGGRVCPPLPRSAYLEHIAQQDFAIGQLEIGALGMSEMEALAAGVPTVANAEAHRAVGLDPVVIDPDVALEKVPELWSSGEEARRAWGDRGIAYLKAAHGPRQCLAALEHYLADGITR